MFEKSLIYRVGDDKQVDVGQLAEALFFYGSTQLLLDRGSVLHLARKLPHDVLLELFDRDAIKLSYTRSHFAMVSNGNPPVHNVGAISFGGAGGKRLKNYQEEILETLERELGRTKSVRKLAADIAGKATLQRLRGVPGGETEIADLARSDFEDPGFVAQAVKTTLESIIPGYKAPANLEFRAMRHEGGGYFVLTNLNMDELNTKYRKATHASDSPLSIAYLLCHLVNARVDTFLAAYYMAEPVTTLLSGQIMQLKHFEFLRSRQRSEADIELFHEIVVPAFPTIREAINSGERSMTEFMNLLDEAQKFKKFLTTTNPDKGLVQNYYREVTKKSWVETLRGKLIRFVVAAGTGFAASAKFGPVGGIGVGAANSFLLDRILKGWRPNRFIEGPYQRFVGGPSATP